MRAAFNPSQNSLVDKLKTKAAEFIDLVDDMKVHQLNKEMSQEERNEFFRLCALAMTEIEDAAMWAVKAATA